MDGISHSPTQSGQLAADYVNGYFGNGMALPIV